MRTKLNQTVVFKKFTLVNFIFSFSLAMVGPLLAPYLEKSGFSSWQISLMFTVFPFINIVFLPFFGRLADQSSKRLIIIFGIFLEIIALFFYLFPEHWYLVVLARLFDALAASVVALIILAKIEDSISPRARGKKTGNYLSIGYIGGILAPFIGALLADYFFIRLPFIVAIIILTVLLLWLYLGDFEHFKHFKIKLSEFSWWEEIKLFLQYRPLRGMAIMGMVMHATNPAMKIFLPLIIVDKLGMSYKAVGAAITIYGLMHLFQGVIGSWGDKWGHNRMVLFGTFLTALTLFVIAFVNSYLLLVFVLFIEGLGMSIWNVSAWSLMSEIGETQKIESQVLTSYFSLAKVGALISFILSAWIAKEWGLEIVFFVAGLVVFFGDILTYRYLTR